MKPVPKTIRDILSEALDLLIIKLAADETSIGVEFPYATGPGGAWKMMPASLSAGYSGDSWSHGNWFCGFWVGLLLAAYLWSEEKRFLIWARERMHLVAPRCEDGNTHDIGFIFYSSALPMHRITGEEEYACVGLRAADRLRARLIPTHAGAYLSRNPIRFPVMFMAPKSSSTLPSRMQGRDPLSRWQQRWQTLGKKTAS